MKGIFFQRRRRSGVLYNFSDFVVDKVNFVLAAGVDVLSQNGNITQYMYTNTSQCLSFLPTFLYYDNNDSFCVKVRHQNLGLWAVIFHSQLFLLEGAIM